MFLLQGKTSGCDTKCQVAVAFGQHGKSARLHVKRTVLCPSSFSFCFYRSTLLIARIARVSWTCGDDSRSYVFRVVTGPDCTVLMRPVARAVLLVSPTWRPGSRVLCRHGVTDKVSHRLDQFHVVQPNVTGTFSLHHHFGAFKEHACVTSA